MKLISSLLFSFLLVLFSTAHASADVGSALSSNESLFLWQDVVLVAGSDRDRDGHDDEHDEFPDDPKEHSDRDKDHVGDNRDEFPDDETEHSDHDKDRKGDNKDEDRDGDGYLNKHEKIAGSDPKDEDSIPADMDGDFIPDVIDPDIDGDGVDNERDLNPTDPTVTTDTVAPVIIAPAAVTVEATGLNTAVVTGVAIAADNVDATITVSSDAPASYPVGTTTVTYSAIDAAGNSSTATQTVTVVDTTAPVITAPAAVSLVSTDGTPVAGVIGQAAATDLFAVNISNDAPALFPVGTTTVIWTARDANGNSSTLTQLVTVTATLADTTPPVIAAPASKTVEASGSFTLVNLGLATATDAVDGTVSVTHNAPAAFSMGNTTVTYSASDAAGNVATATQLITVVDTKLPAISAPADKIAISGVAQSVAISIGQATASDAFTVSITNDAPAAFPVGTTTVTWTATDANGNVSTATQLVTVNLGDLTPPTITAPANITTEATGTLTPVILGAASATDIVDGVVAVSSDAPASFPLGTTTVTYSSTDAAGNSATAVQLVTVVDTTAPVITAPADATGTSGDNQPVSIVTGQASATDLFAVTVTSDAPTRFSVGATTVTWTATDASGNASTTSQLVTVTLNDTTPPTITAPANIAVEATAVNTPVTPGLATATDIVDGVVNVNNDAPTAFPLGITTVTYSAIDAAGNAATAIQQVTVADTTAPVVTAPDRLSLTSLDGNPVSGIIGQANAVDTFAVIITNDAPASFPVGTTIVTWSAVDESGNTATATQEVVVTQAVVDMTPPVISVPTALTVEATAVNTPVVLNNVTAADDVDGVLPVTNNAPASFPLGTTPVTYIATDSAGNNSSATQQVHVVDTTKPVISAPAGVALQTNDGNPVSEVIGTATATDIFAVTVTNDAPATFPVGSTIVTWSAVDANGNTSSATQTVTVSIHDLAAPVITAPGPITIEATGDATPVVLGSATATDNIDGAVAVSNDAPVVFPLGTTIVTYSATDNAGNSATATQQVTVEDTTAPVITAPVDGSAVSGDNQPVSVVTGQATASDAFAVTISSDAAATFPVGTTTVTWTAVDVNGNSATATQLVTVTLDDVTPPAITAPANVTAEAAGTSTSVSLGVATAADAVDGVVVVTSDAPASFPLGATTVTYSASDAAGNTASATQLVTVEDTTAPVLTVPADATGSSGDNQPVSVAIGQATATDIFAVNIINDAPVSFPVGTTTVIWTATDVNGNSATATQLVTVSLNDITPPTITSPTTVSAEATGLTSSVAIGSATATDIVDGAVTVTSDAPATFPLGTTTVTYSAMDAAGNTATATQLITVVDTTSPIITVPADATATSSDSQPVSVLFGQATATDAFAATITNDAPALFAVGTTTVTWTATDANGNSTTATQLVTVSVNDITPPSITVPANVTAEATGLATVVVNIGTATATDIIDGTVSVTSDAPATFPLGTTTVTYSAADAAGNTATASQLVTVVDTTAPAITAPAGVFGSFADNQPVPLAIGQATATDAFAVTITNNAPATFPVGSTTVIWTATDANGNSVTATQLVTVTLNDLTPPIVTAPATVTTQATGALTFVLNIGWATAIDAVDSNVTITNDAPASYSLGTTSVTWTAVDASGNTSTAVQNVIVQDTTAPVVTAPAAITLTSTDGNPVAGVIGMATATDVFAVTVTSNAPAAFPIGNTTVTWTATDANGNSSTATQLLTVADASAPFTFIAPPDVEVQTILPNGIPWWEVQLGRPTVKSTVAVNWTWNPPGRFPIGTTQVTWTATDANGNVISSVQLVTLQLVQDVTPPVLTVPADFLAASLDGNPVAIDIGQATVTDDFSQPTVTNDAPAIFPVGTTTVTWTATDTSGNSISATQKVVVVLDQQLLANLPPDPGPAGDLTLEGVDSDADGVRDDVQRWIVLTYPNSQKTREALLQGGKTMQEFILNAADPVSSYNSAIQTDKDGSCLAYILSSGFSKVSSEHQARFLNTYQRSKAWLEADSHLSGHMLKGLGFKDWKKGCNFDPDAMAN